MYSVSDVSSFKAVDKWVKQVRENAPSSCSIILIGNNSDVPFNEREVKYEQGMEAAKNHGIEFFEVSTMLNTGVNDAMTALARQMTTNFESLSFSATPEGAE